MTSINSLKFKWQVIICSIWMDGLKIYWYRNRLSLSMCLSLPLPLSTLPRPLAPSLFPSLSPTPSLSLSLSSLYNQKAVRFVGGILLHRCGVPSMLFYACVSGIIFSSDQLFHFFLTCRNESCIFSKRELIILSAGSAPLNFSSTILTMNSPYVKEIWDNFQPCLIYL